MTLDAVTDEAELALIKEFVSRLRMVPELNKDYERLRGARAQARSQMAADDEATSWLHMSHLVGHCLDMANDNLRALHALILGVDDDRILLYQFAHYPILRAALEASSQALWILKPPAARDRIVRLLQSRVSEARFDRELMKEATALHTDDDRQARSSKQKAVRHAAGVYRKHTLQIATIAANAGIAESEYSSGLPGYSAVVYEATDSKDVQGNHGSTIWKIISGLSHPSASRATHFSNREEISESEDGILHVKLTTNVSWAHLALLAALSNYKQAVQMTRMRMIKPAER